MIFVIPGIIMKNVFGEIPEGMEELSMEKKQMDWENLGFGYVQTEKRYVSNYKDGKWDDGVITEDAEYCTE